ncbi:uncharacterized protein BHQ10_002856 [Talaromyces amestolkiae]|uniref:GPI ethanolamine phosphate transferase 2 n=1 Tax=Talaromyces amestolkiae TaxID=1196081 RepID=A0A364KTG1_TALAM|nr:uncharacterized protein BHQ10_002856 [Talaromyces amestolkiae]RAO66844.1 hypothetical protein BHQ10_002856 [Talaromyces amestolkiae]
MNRTEATPTWLHGLKAAYADRNLTYAGTRTWTDLYPDVFDRSNPTDANFVPDYMSVDEVVRKHVEVELQNDDWAALVLHLAGVDHIGHIGGPDSPYMIPKEREIDKLVQQIFNAISEKSYLQNTLFILVGDHGMDSRGNHGGSLESEMSAALVFMSPVFQRLYPGQESPTRPIEGNFGYHKLIDQTDIVPTISGLIGVTVPKLNLGVVIPDLLPLWKNTHEHVNLLHQNAAQIMALYLDWLSLSPAADYEIFNLWKRVEIELDSSPGNALSVLYEAGESPSHLAVLIQAYLERNTVFLWILVATTYAISGHYLSSGLGQYEARIYSVFRLLLQGLALAAFLFKFYSTLTITPQLVAFAPLWVYKSSHYIDIITLYRVLGAGLISGIAFVLYRAKRGFRREENIAALTELSGLYLMTQSRVHNVPLFLIYRIQLQLFAYILERPNVFGISFLVSLLSQSAYSAFGYNNSVATLDIPLGFNGVNYWVASTIQLIQWQLFITMWAGSTWWVCAGLGLLANAEDSLDKPPQNRNTFKTEELNGHQNGTTADASKKTFVENDSVLGQGKWTTYLAYITLFQAVGLIRLIGAAIWYRDDPVLWTVILHAAALVAMKLIPHTTVNCLFSGLIWLKA